MKLSSINLNSAREIYIERISRFFAVRDSSITTLLIYIVRNIHSPYKNIKYLPIKWLDEVENAGKTLLRKGGKGLAFHPNFNEKQNNTSNVQLPDIFCLVVANAVVSPTSSSIITNENQVIIERVAGLDQSKVSYSAGQILSHGVKKALVTMREATQIEDGIFLGGNGSFNYYHWVVEILPKLQFITDKSFQYKEYPLLLSDDVAHIQTFKELLDIFVGGFKVITLNKSKQYLVRNLVYINAPSNLPFNLRDGEPFESDYTQISDESIRYIRNTVFASVLSTNQGTAPYPDRVFLCRKQETRKYNQNEVFGVLEKLSFKKIYMEDLTIREQVKIAYNASYIVGATGAAWTNLIFCQEGAKCLCWMAEEYSEFSAYSTIAEIVGVDLRYVSYKANTSSTGELYESDYVISTDSIQEGLLRLGLSIDTDRVSV